MMAVTTFSNAATSVPNITSNASQQISAATSDTEKTAGDYQDFLTLLTAQLKNQDPLQPLDSTTFVSQLAQFSNVEQQVKMNTKLDGLVANLTGSDFSEASNYLGKYVAIDGGKTYIGDDDTQTSFKYQTDENAKSVKALITDRFGKEVKNISLPLAPNGITQNWNLTDTDGEKVEQGLYNITIETTDNDNIVTKNPAQTKVKILQAQKTNSGFEFLTNTNQTIQGNDIGTVYAQ